MTLQKVSERILRAWVDSYLDLRDQLAAEREKAKQWQSNYASLHKELIEERRLHDLRNERIPANEMSPAEELAELKMRQGAR